MNIIAAVDNNWGIGYDNKLLFSIPEDMKYFKKLTEGKVVVMGHSTLLSLPNSRCLKNRKNIILSRNKELRVDDGIVCDSISQLMAYVAHFDKDDVFVIGGHTVYEQLLDYCRVAYITKIRTGREADRFFPNIDELPNWEKICESAKKTYDKLDFVFTKYINTKVCL